MSKYSGRLACDGYGNLLADEGERKGEPVKFEDGDFTFVEPGDPSHNDEHELSVKEFTATTDESAGSPDKPTEGEEHHWGITDDDPHHDRVRFVPDSHSATLTGHTEAWK